MVKVGYHASHEQFPPSRLLEWAAAAEAAGFQGAMSSDHFHPWGPRQGESGFAWSWLGAAMQATRMPFGVVTSPVGFRYHPAIVAQACASLSEMFPGRFWAALGSGEALNEHVVAARWPAKPERNERLAEAVEIMRALLRGEEVTRRGLIPVDRARLYTRPATPPPFYVAALSPETAAWGAEWADGLITIRMPREQLRRVVDAWRSAGGEGRPMLVQVHLSFAEDEETALRSAHEAWGTNALPGSITENLETPEQFQTIADALVRPEDVLGKVLVSADTDEHARRLRDLAEMGFTEMHLHNVGSNQREFIDAFGARVLPQLASES